MDDKELERRLNKEAKKIEVKDFSERWERIQPRLEQTAVLQEQLESELVPLAEAGAIGKHKCSYKKGLLIGGICLLLCAIILAIVLPLTLGSTNKLYYNYNIELLHRVSDQEEFYSEIDVAGIPVPNFLEYEIESYGLWVTDDNVTKGWELEYYDETNESFVGLDIYMEDVVIHSQNPSFAENSLTTMVNGVSVRYLLHEEDDAYMLWAIATYNNCGYRFEILSANENIFAVLETLFQ